MLPLDVAVTPNGLRAVVRSVDVSPPFDDWVSLWNLANGARITIPANPNITPSGGESLALLQLSDAIQATNDRAIAVASMQTTTNITVVDIAAPLWLASHSITGTGEQQAGETNDVAITPDGAFGVVNSRNWIHVIDLSDGSVAAAFNIGSSTGFQGPCSPNGAVDSVACTNTRAIVTTGRTSGGLPTCWVYMIDLASTPPSISAGVQQEFATNRANNPHDLAVDATGALAVVTSGDAVGLYDLFARTQVGVNGGNTILNTRSHRLNADSVEISGQRAICLSDEVLSPSPLTRRWVCTIYDISGGGCPSCASTPIPMIQSPT